jgi:holo-[acyl-carrier protein] synthase
MCIAAHGIDIVDVERFAKLIEKGGEAFLERCFVRSEIEEASYKTNERLAAWFAVKEAVLKALGTGHSNGAIFTDIVVVHNEIGAPFVELSGRTRELAESIGIKKWFVSISHINKIAVASAIGSS